LVMQKRKRERGAFGGEKGRNDVRPFSRAHWKKAGTPGGGRA